MTSTISRRIIAGVAATTLALGVTACSEAEDAASSAGDAAGSATSAAGSAAASATSAASSAAESATSASSESAEGETTEFKTADGKSVLVPAAFAKALTDAEGKGDFGTPATIEEGEDGTFLAAFDNGNHITFSEETGAVELIGEIGNTWISEGGLTNPVGLPKAAESAVDGGWSQEFQNGTISWLKGATGDFAAEVEQA